MKNWLLIFALFSAAFTRAQEPSADDVVLSEEESADGWIIRRTKKGIIKIPKKQKFTFEGVDVEGDTQRPSQSVLGSRSTRQNTSLIPVRTSFKEEFLDVSGVRER